MRKLSLQLFAVLFSVASFGQQHNFWTLTDESTVGKNFFATSQRPPVYKIFQLSDAAFKLTLLQAPSEKLVSASHSSFIVSFPLPNGGVEQFRIVDAPVMDQALAARYPGINSYAGQGIEDPSSTIRFDVSPQGMNAIILSAKRPTIYIDKLEGNYYRVVSRKDILDYPSHFQCLTEDKKQMSANGISRPEDADDGKLRTYRLAMISSAEFSNHFIPSALPTLADSIAVVIAVQNSHVTRTNAVFERDFGVRLVLVANNDLLVYFDPATDPVNNPNNPSQTPLHTAITTAIGSANFDIGHTECKSTSFGNNNGNAGCIGCVCTDANKARGFTSYNNPSLLEFFVIDYLTHEIGHQFGANHTFSFQLEGTGVNVEPGSGVTIMGYAGITGSTDVAAHSIELFSVKSIEQVTNYIKTGNGASCAVVTTTGNTAPAVNAGADYTIPRSTPFKLTGTASDVDAADVLSYNWEQIDNRSGAFSSIPNASATDGPMFRTYLPYTTPVRTFPEIPYILSGANGFQWEVLPAVGRPLNFRFIAKDNHPGGGNNKTDDMVVNVDGTTGPFSVTVPNTAVTWTGGATETVSWSVAGTTGAPVNCANVNILFSSDGGNTFSMLLANTPNDGTETVTCPGITSSTARIKVEAVGNIFFDISNTNFNVAPPPNSFDFTSPAPAVSTCPAGLSMNITLGTFQNGIFPTPVVLTANGNPGGTSVSFSPNPVIPGNNTVVTLSNTNTLAPGSYIITVTGTAGVIVRTRNITYTILAAVSPTINTQPVDKMICVGGSTSFFIATTGANSFQWQVSTDGGSSFNNISNGGVYLGTAAPLLIITGATAAMNNYKYRCLATGTCTAPVPSSAATLTVINPVSISGTGQPVSSVTCSGGNISYTVTGTSTLPVIYQWQEDRGLGFTNITNGGMYAGATSATLTLTGVSAAMNGYQYRSLLSNASCTVPTVSNGASLTVRQLPTVTLVAAPLTSLLPGQTTRLTASPTAATGGALSITWYHGSNVVTNSGNTRLINIDSIGEYSVKIEETFSSPALVCSNQSTIVKITATPSNKLFIFPTPNDGRFTVSYFNAEEVSTKRMISLYDSKGVVVYSREFSVAGPYTLLSIDMEAAIRGIYFLMVSDVSGKRLAVGKVHIR